MTQKSSVGNKIAAVVVIAVIATISAISCTKTKQPTANEQFVSDWIGSKTCSYSNSTATTVSTNATAFIGAQSSDGNVVTIGESFGYTDCYKAYPVIGTVNGNHFSIAPQNFSDRCGAGYLISGNAVLGSTGTLTLSTTVTSDHITTCVFIGVKK